MIFSPSMFGREAVSGLATSISEILAAENEGKEPEQHE